MDFFNFDLFLIGFGVGLLSVLPVGPINIMCINRSLHRGLAAGLATGAGGLMADVLFAGAAIFGVKFIVSFINTYHVILQSVGGTILILIGILLMRSKAKFKDDTTKSTASALSLALGAFVVTFANPAPIFYFASAFSGLGGALSGEQGFANALALLIGVTAGAGSWWLTLAIVVSKLRDKFSLKWLSRVNLLSGGLLVIFGAIILADYVLGLDIMESVL